MAKIEQQKEKVTELKQPLKLTQDEFWEWKHSIALIGRANAEFRTAEAESKMLQLEYQNKALQIQLHNKTRLEAAKHSVETSMGEYNTVKSRIESRLGVSLNNRAIDEISLEVKELPNN